MAGRPRDSDRKQSPRLRSDGVIPSPFRYCLPIPQELTILREEAGLTKTEAADRIGVNRHTIGRWESGNGPPNVEKLRKLLAVYRTEILDEEDLAMPGKLAIMRDKAGLTKTEAADRVGVERETIWRWETGRGSPQIDTLQELLAVYRVEIASESV